MQESQRESLGCNWYCFKSAWTYPVWCSVVHIKLLKVLRQSSFWAHFTSSSFRTPYKVLRLLQCFYLSYIWCEHESLHRCTSNDLSYTGISFSCWLLLLINSHEVHSARSACWFIRFVLPIQCIITRGWHISNNIFAAQLCIICGGFFWCCWCWDGTILLGRCRVEKLTWFGIVEDTL